MNRRTTAALVAIGLLVAGLAAWRAGRPDPGPPAGVASLLVEGRPTVLDFGRDECASCREMRPVLEELARRHEGRVTVRIVDMRDDAGQAVADSFRVVLIPTQVFLDASGREVSRHEGSISLDDLEAEIGRHGWTTAR